MLTTLSFSAILAILPISELRGAIPYAIAKEVPLVIAYPFCVAINALIGPLVYLFLSSVHKGMVHFGWYNRMFDALVERARKKVHAKVERFGYLGLAIFVAIPLPITGAYTGTLGAWMLGMDPKKTMLAVLAGVLIAGVVVSAVTFLGIEALSIFVKNIAE